MNRIPPAALALLLAASALLAACDRKGASPDNPARPPMPSASAASQ